MDGTGAGFYLIRAQGRTIATVYPFDKAEDAANALLFAAAPELLANLKTAYEMLNAMTAEPETRTEAMRAAIAKAEGRQ
jgi:hypothetical protein